MEHNDFLPSFEQPAGPNVHDVHDDFILFMQRDYGIELEYFYCPSQPKWWVEKAISMSQEETFSYCILGYNLWVPRFTVMYGQLPPDHDSAGPLPVADTTGPFRGPVKLTDPLATCNPVMTDQTSTLMIHPSAGDLSRDRYLISSNIFCHQWNGVIEVSNQVFADTHVEAVHGSHLLPRYGTGKWWEWR